jgi:hypothetical protein
MSQLAMKVIPMSDQKQRPGGIAETANLDLVATALERLMNRTEGLPGIGLLYGPAGWGKTVAASRLANRYRGYYVQMRSCWTRKTLLEKIVGDMGIKPARTMPAILDQIAQQLAGSRRPLLIDEFDYCAASPALVELVRDIHEAAGSAPILCIGEEGLPQVLAAHKYERFDSRILARVPAAPVNLPDALKLRPIYAPEAEIQTDLLERLVALAAGSVRRVCVNLELIQEEALVQGWGRVDLKTWGDRALYTGQAPQRRVG